MTKLVKLTAENSYWTCHECYRPHIARTTADKVRCVGCGKEFTTTQGDMKQELKLTQERLKMVEYTLEQYKTILIDGIPKLVEPKNVIVHYRCCECKATIDMPIKKVGNIFTCDQCSYIENFMEIVAVGIKID